MDMLEYVDYNKKSDEASDDKLLEERQRAKAVTKWKTLEDNSKSRSDDDENTAKSDGINLLAGDELEEYALDKQGVLEDDRRDLELEAMRGSGHEENIDIPEGDEWHREYGEKAADYRPDMVERVDTQAQARRTQRTGIGEAMRKTAELSGTLSGLAREAKATHSGRDNRLVHKLEEAMRDPNSRSEFEKDAKTAGRAVEDAMEEDELEQR